MAFAPRKKFGNTPLGAGGGLTDGDKGDITVAGSGTTLTIDARAVTFAKAQAIATARLLGRTTAGSGDIEELTASQVAAMLGGAPAPGAGLPYMYPNGDAISDALNDNFRLDASLDTTGARFSGASAWSWVNQGSATATIVRKRLHLAIPAATGGVNSFRIIKQTLPSGSWIYRAKLYRFSTATSSTDSVGMCLRESGTGKLVIIQTGLSGSFLVWCARWNSPTSFNATVGGTETVPQDKFLAPVWFEIEKDGSNYYFRFSFNDVYYWERYSEAHAAFFTTAADEIGLFAYDDAGNAQTLVSPEFYRIA